MNISERHACRVLNQHRSTQRHVPKDRADEERLVADMIELARQYGRYGYRRIATLLREAGWQVNAKRIERLWRREGLKVKGQRTRKGLKAAQSRSTPKHGLLGTRFWLTTMAGASSSPSCTVTLGI